MKKILLIIALTLCIFQLIVMATAINIGYEATDRTSAHTTVATWVVEENAADGNGTITTVEIWADSEMSGVKVATFFKVDATHWTTRDYETVNNGNGAGVVLAGSKQTFTVSLDVQTGDYIGWYHSGGGIERTVEDGYNFTKLEGDYIPCTNQVEATTYPNIAVSIGGTGATGEEEEAEDNAIFFGMNF